MISPTAGLGVAGVVLPRSSAGHQGCCQRGRSPRRPVGWWFSPPSARSDIGGITEASAPRRRPGSQNRRQLVRPRRSCSSPMPGPWVASNNTCSTSRSALVARRLAGGRDLLHVPRDAPADVRRPESGWSDSPRTHYRCGRVASYPPILRVAPHPCWTPRRRREPERGLASGGRTRDCRSALSGCSGHRPHGAPAAHAADQWVAPLADPPEGQLHHTDRVCV